MDGGIIIMGKLELVLIKINFKLGVGSENSQKKEILFPSLIVSFLTK